MPMFIDGTGITPGTDKCVCGNECEFPCWQRLGWAPPCETCGCAQRGMTTMPSPVLEAMPADGERD